MNKTLTLIFALFCGTCIAQETNVVIVLDDSGSMAESFTNQEDKMQVAKRAITNVLESIDPNVNVGLVTLNSRVDGNHWIYPLSKLDKSSFTKRLLNVPSGGGTPLSEAVKNAADGLLKKRADNPYGIYKILVVTDGFANDSLLLDSYVDNLLKKGISLETIGVKMSSEHDLAKKSNNYMNANDFSTLKKGIGAVFAEFSDNSSNPYDMMNGLDNELAKSVIRSIIYIDNSPIGYEIPRIKTELLNDQSSNSNNNYQYASGDSSGMGATWLATFIFIVIFFIFAVVILSFILFFIKKVIL